MPGFTAKDFNVKAGEKVTFTIMNYGVTGPDSLAMQIYSETAVEWTGQEQMS